MKNVAADIMKGIFVTVIGGYLLFLITSGKIKVIPPGSTPTPTTTSTPTPTPTSQSTLEPTLLPQSVSLIEATYNNMSGKFFCNEFGAHIQTFESQKMDADITGKSYIVDKLIARRETVGEHNYSSIEYRLDYLGGEFKTFTCTIYSPFGARVADKDKYNGYFELYLDGVLETSYIVEGPFEPIDIEVDISEATTLEFRLSGYVTYYYENGSIASNSPTIMLYNPCINR